VIGPLALAALLFAVVRRLIHADTEAIGALSGVAAVVAQNVLDFSLELPGVALPVAAILGAAGVGVAKKVKISAREGWRAAALLAAPAAAAGLCLMLAFDAGDLEHDVARISAGEVSSLEEIEAIAARHPVNVYVAAKASFVAENRTPPENRKAISWANRALYLAPTYADTHFVVGRLLINAGRRGQGFTAVREAWRLASLDRRPRFVREIVHLAKDPAEVIEAVPRRNLELDIPEERSLALASRVARELKKNEWSPVILAAASIADAPADALMPLAKEAVAAGAPELAERAVLRRRELMPNDAAVALMLAKNHLTRGALADAKREAELAAAAHGAREVAAAYRMLIDIALAEKDEAAARRAYTRLAGALPNDRRGQVELAEYEATIEERSGKPSRAVSALTRAIQLAPEELDLRLRRAELHLDTGHLKLASDDVVYVLARQPENRRAKRLAERIEHRR
jgi:Tfp pilus assembly protein PilF